jgi:hypothetical protein
VLLDILATSKVLFETLRQGFLALQIGSTIMRILLVASLLISTGFASSAFAKSFPCADAVQNWQAGSGLACPYDSNGGLPPAPAVVAPVIIVPVVVKSVKCASLRKDILPLILRKTSVSDFAGNLAAPESGCD